MLLKMRRVMMVMMTLLGKLRNEARAKLSIPVLWLWSERGSCEDERAARRARRSRTHRSWTHLQECLGAPL